MSFAKITSREMEKEERSTFAMLFVPAQGDDGDDGKRGRGGHSAAESDDELEWVELRLCWLIPEPFLPPSRASFTTGRWVWRRAATKQLYNEARVDGDGRASSTFGVETGDHSWSGHVPRTKTRYASPPRVVLPRHKYPFDFISRSILAKHEIAARPTSSRPAYTPGSALIDVRLPIGGVVDKPPIIRPGLRKAETPASGAFNTPRMKPAHTQPSRMRPHHTPRIPVAVLSVVDASWLVAGAPPPSTCRKIADTHLEYARLRRCGRG
uniref:Uncharacterized protein n=1 Tax=Mycena chlorophos TaxID=658473 RepID=A0ABQ0KVD4_MYCCL|nr:predicted protein [Mycena chlorophos]